MLVTLSLGECHVATSTAPIFLSGNPPVLEPFEVKHIVTVGEPLGCALANRDLIAISETQNRLHLKCTYSCPRATFAWTIPRYEGRHLTRRESEESCRREDSRLFSTVLIPNFASYLFGQTQKEPI